jgi:hypothetical protein
MVQLLVLVRAAGKKYHQSLHTTSLSCSSYMHWIWRSADEGGRFVPDLALDILKGQDSS